MLGEEKEAEGAVRSRTEASLNEWDSGVRGKSEERWEEEEEEEEEQELDLDISSSSKPERPNDIVESAGEMKPSNSSAAKSSLDVRRRKARTGGVGTKASRVAAKHLPRLRGGRRVDCSGTSGKRCSLGVAMDVDVEVE